MRQVETALGTPVPPGFQIVARLDGRGFIRLTKESESDEISLLFHPEEGTFGRPSVEIA
jgi:hypothetical protein